MMPYDSNKYVFLGSIIVLGGAVLAYILRKKNNTHDEDELQPDSDLHIGNGDTEPVKDKDVLVLGIQGSGKTALLEGVSGNDHSTSKPTEGFNIVSLPGPSDNRHNLIELGGGEKPRQYWRHFYREKSLLIFVVDASQQAKLPESKQLLHELLNEPHLKDLAVILVAHKQDASGAVDGDEILKAMDVKSFTQAGRNIYPLQTQTPPNGTACGTKELGSIITKLLCAAK